MENKSRFKNSWFFKWFINNKVVTALLVVALLLINLLLLHSLDFVFAPIGDFLGVIGLPLMLAAVFYFLLNPLVDWLEKYKIPRLVSIIVIFVILAALIAWGLSNAVPGIVDRLNYFTHRVPHYVGQANKQLNNLLQDQRFGQFRPQIDALSQNLGQNLIDWSRSFSATLVTSLTDLVSQTANIFISLVVFPFVLFYLLLEGRRLNGYISHFLPNAWREKTATILTEMTVQIANYVRGQVIVAVLVTLMLLVGLPLIGLRYAVMIAIMSGLFNLVPFLGFWLSILPAMIIGLATGGPIMLLKVLIVYVVEQTIESRLISPLVLGSQLKIHPVTIIFILLTAGKIWGVWGVILAIPAYAAIKVLVTHFFTWYREISDLYVNADPPEEE